MANDSHQNEAARDFRKEFTEQVVAAIEAGQKLPWEKPWRAVGSPRNAVSEKNYNGMNRLLLGVEMLEKGWDDPRFVTFKQAVALGGAVNKGERGTQIEKWTRTEFWQRKDVQVFAGQQPVTVVSVDHGQATLRTGNTVQTDSLRAEHRGKSFSWNGAESELTLLGSRAYVVFNVAQCRDLQIAPVQKPEAIAPEQRVLHIQQAMQAQTQLQFATGPSAFYIPAADTVYTPKPETFKSLGDYQSTLLHEIGHATGHEKRLNRPTLTAGARFGSPEYAREELRAELFSAFIAMETGVARTRDEQHHAYLQSWADALKRDKNEVFKAAADAARAVDYVKAKELEIDKRVALDTPAKDVLRIEDAKRVTGSLQSRAPGENGREILHVRRAGEDLQVSVPAGAVPALPLGAAVRMQFDTRRGLTVDTPGKGKQLSIS